LILNILQVSPRRGEVLFFVSPKKSTQKKGDTEGLVVNTPELARPLRSLAMRFSAVRVLAELAAFAAPVGWQMQLDRAVRIPLLASPLRRMRPAMLGCA